MTISVLMGRRAALSRTAAFLVVCGVAGFLPGWSARVETSAEAAGTETLSDDGRRRTIVWDVAIDCRTWRFNAGVGFDEFGRGDGFIANGKIFPGGTLLPGTESNDPNDPGSIGSWVQRGTMAATLSEIVAGTRPAFFATWFHLLDDGAGVVADGPHPESGPMAIVGGMGRFRGAGGELVDEIIGSNITGCPNLRVTITLEKQAPK